MDLFNGIFNNSKNSSAEQKDSKESKKVIK